MSGAYHKRKLEECGGDVREVALAIAKSLVPPVELYEDKPILPNINAAAEQILPLLQLHTAKAVEEATAKYQVTCPSVIQMEETIATLQKQCESLQEDANRDALQYEGKCTEILVLQDQCDDLRTRYEEEKAIVSRIWTLFGNPSYESLSGKSIYDLIEDLRTRAEKAEAELELIKYSLDESAKYSAQQFEQLRKAEAEVAELKANNRYQKGYAAGEKETMDQLTQLQQDVRPLVQSLRNIAAAGNAGMPDLPRREDGAIRTTKVHATEALETFLAKHPTLGGAQ